MIFNPNNSFTAKITVTYQPGNVCTCTNGVVTLTAPDTSGTVTFVVHTKGDWTISDGIETKTVNITQAGQSVIINERHIYIMGEGAGVTGGGTFSHLTGNTFSWSVQLPGHTWQTGYTGWVGQAAKVDLSAYNKLVVEIDSLSGMNIVTQFGITVRDVTGYDVPNFNLRDRAGGQTAEFDISSFSGENYIGIAARNDRPAFSYPSITGRVYVM